MNLATAVKRSIEQAHTTRAKTTANSYRFGVKNFLAMLAEEGIKPEDQVNTVTIEHFIQFPAWISAQGFAKGTVLAYQTGVKYFLEWLIIQGVLRPDYAEKIRLELAGEQTRRKQEKRLPRFPGRTDAAHMVEVVQSLPYPTPLKERNVAIVLFLATSGCRNAEICSLRVRDFQDEDQSAVVMGKGSKERRVFFSSEAADALRHYWAVRGNSAPDAPAFARHDKGAGRKMLPITTVTVRTIVKEVAGAAGIEKFTPHYFRHAFGIQVLGETGNLALTQDMLGHASPKSTRVYAKIYADDLKRAHEEIFG